MDNPDYKKFLSITATLIILDTFFVNIVSIDEATLVFIRSYQTTINTLLFLIVIGLVMIAINRPTQKRYYTTMFKRYPNRGVKEK